MRTNVLHNYTSYASHMLFFLCKDTVQAEELCTSSASEFLSVATSRNGMFTTGPVPLLNGAILICNTMKDANPIINRINWTTYLVPDASPSGANSIATDGSLTFTEYKTFDFYRIYNEAIQTLGADPQSAVWVVKPIFIGFTANGAQYVSDVNPFMFLLVDSTAKYSTSGSTYNFKFVGMSNGFAKNQQLHIQSSGEFTLTPDASTSISSALQSLSTYYNNLYIANRDQQIKANPQYANYKQVRYNITADPIYNSPEYALTEFEIADRGNPAVQSGSIFLHTNNIEQGIHEVMKLSRKPSEDAIMMDNKFQTYKIISSVDTFDTELVLNFKIVPFITPAVTNVMDNAQQNAAADSVGQLNDYYQFNYLNTGKNIDLLNFDIMVNYGLVLLQNLHSTVPLQSGGSTNTKDESLAIRDGIGIKTNNPILTPSIMITPPNVRNRVFHDAQLSYQQAISKHAFVEALESKIRIRGNPDLLGRFNTLPSQMMETTPDWASKFILCKIDVGVPNSSNHPGVGSFQSPFWYDGFYAMLSVEHIFEDNQFTQEIELMSIPSMENPVIKTGQPENE